MFESRGEVRDSEVRSGAEAGAFSLLDDVAALEDVGLSCVAENRFAARKVLAAGRFWESWIERDVRLGSGDIMDCGNGAIAELSVRMGCSKTVAESHASLGMDLWLRLPLVRAEFEAGWLDLSRVRVVSRETMGLKPETVAALEPGIVAAALQLTPGPLAGEVHRLVCEFSPEEAAEQREAAQEFGRRVVKRGSGNTSTIEVTVSPEEAEQVMQLVAEFAATVCPHDKRGKQYLLVDAIMAIMHGEPYLQCSCERDDCSQAGRTALPGRRAPLTQITMDVATLLGLLSRPAYLHGHGLIDPELARRLATDGTWQALLTEALDLAEELGLINHDDDGSDTDTDVESNADADNSAADGAEAEAENGTIGAGATRGDDGLRCTRDSDSGESDFSAAESAAAAEPPDDIAPEPEPDREAGPEPEPEAESEPDVDSETDTSAQAEPDPPNPDPDPHEPGTPPPPSAPLPMRFCLRSFLARGNRRKAGYVPEFGTLPPAQPCITPPPPRAQRRHPNPPPETTRPGSTTQPVHDTAQGTGTTAEPGTSTTTPAPTSVGTIIDAITAAIEADPTLARPQYPDGHGGLTTPPDGALTYRPDAATTALVRARDGHCRFPGCTRPAAQCQLDHIIEYWLYNPASGGWTIVTNLQCLCQFHHQLKTLGFWRVIALPGHALLWTSNTGTTAVTLPAGAHGNNTIDTPSPHIVGRRGYIPPSTPPTPPDPPPF
ncbi:DUF222 domain-containing protein [Rhodococcus sp. NPDC058485]|uniref:HNH endonuclease signature motif containing protein n=1 Tax=Rhodococcus sp. NPDC058485 TaxID=3346525 RepID=UPI00365ADFE1